MLTVVSFLTAPRMGKILTTLQKKLSNDHSCVAQLPFRHLPDVCKLHIFSYLNTHDRMSASRVCVEWHQLLKSPMLWTNVDIPAQIAYSHRGGRCLSRREAVYRLRMRKFLEFICEMNPAVHRFVFVGDIADTEYHDILQSFINNTRLLELIDVTIDWTKLPIVVPPESDSGRTDERHRRRQRLFVRLFERFTRVAPNITSLNLPFDWSVKSVDAIVRLQNLKQLSLSRYSELQALDCFTLDRVIRSLPHLRRLNLEVWTPCATGGLSFFSIHSDSLECLDVSQSRGFALTEVYLPRLKELHVSRRQWSGPLAIRNVCRVASMLPPCLHTVLSYGAPNICWLNEHKLHADWCSNIYDELDLILKSICPCPAHCHCVVPIEVCF